MLDKLEHMRYYNHARLAHLRAYNPKPFDFNRSYSFSKSNKIVLRLKNVLFAPKTSLFHLGHLKNGHKLAKNALAAP
jgi:hypothetical protein